jgi:hypothetical protein
LLFELDSLLLEFELLELLEFDSDLVFVAALDSLLRDVDELSEDLA